MLSRPLCTRSRPITDRALFPKRGGRNRERGRLQFTGSASALVSASRQAPRAPTSTLYTRGGSGVGRERRAARGSRLSGGEARARRTPRGFGCSRAISRRAHVGRAYPASREGGPPCCVYADPRVRAGMRAPRNPASREGGPPCCVYACPCRHQPTARSAGPTIHPCLHRAWACCVLSRPLCTRSRPITDRALFPKRGGRNRERGRLQFTGSASALVSASRQAPRAPTSTLYTRGGSGVGRERRAARGSRLSGGEARARRTPRGFGCSRAISRRAHVGRAYPASREGGPPCCVYADPRVRAGMRAPRNPASREGGPPCCVYACPCRHQPTARSAGVGNP